LEISLEKKEKLLKSLKSDYKQMKIRLESDRNFGRWVPSWKQVKEALTPEVMYQAAKFVQPKLVISPLDGKVGIMHKEEGEINLSLHAGDHPREGLQTKDCLVSISDTFEGGEE
jgi:hypothetical protein